MKKLYKKYITLTYIFLFKFSLCGKVSSPKSRSVSYAHAPDSLLAQLEESGDGLALKKSTRPGPLPDYKNFGVDIGELVLQKPSETSWAYSLLCRI